MNKTKKKPLLDAAPRVDANIAEFGWSIVTGPEKEGFAYTVGLTEARLAAELCLHGVTDVMLAARLLDQLAQRVISDQLPPLATRVSGVLRDLDVMLLQADTRARDLAVYAKRRYGAPVRMIQCVLPDANNRFPWNRDVDRWQVFGQVVMARWPKDDTPAEAWPSMLELMAR